MRICFLGDGQHTNTRSWIRYLAEVLGHEVHLITFGQIKSPSEKIAVYSLDASRDIKTFLRYLAYIPRLKRLISEIRPDILIGYRITSYGFMAACSGFHPLVLAAQGQNIAYNNSWIKARFAGYAIRCADFIHAWGSHMAQKIADFGGDPNKILTLPRGINTNLFTFPATERLDSSGFQLITTRGLNPDYNFEQILESLSLLSDSKKKFKYIIAGEGSHKAALVQKVKDLGLESHVEFAGKIEYEALPEYLQASDIYLSTVVTDGVSSSLLEAMSCGVFPVVTNNSANKLWIEDGVNGFLVNFGDPKELARKIEAAMKDSMLRRKAREINREIVLERASLEKNMRIFEAAWKKLIFHE